MSSGTSDMLGEMNRCVRFCGLENSQTLLCGGSSHFGGLEHLPVTQEVPGSSPVAPGIQTLVPSLLHATRTECAFFFQMNCGAIFQMAQVNPGVCVS